MASILWSGPKNTMIRTTLDDAGSGHRLAGTVLTIRDKVPLEIRYVILTDNEWAPRDVGIHILGGEADVSLALAADGKGSWTLDNEPLTDFDGCLDIDLGFTPATKSITIKRLGLEPGDSRRIKALSVGFPGEPVGANSHSYTRLDEHRYLHIVAGHEEELVLNEAGLALAYGPWRAVAEG